jgi:hypothetical protein
MGATGRETVERASLQLSRGRAMSREQQTSEGVARGIAVRSATSVATAVPGSPEPPSCGSRPGNDTHARSDGSGTEMAGERIQLGTNLGGWPKKCRR